jgi:pilus assembly protein FimV
MIITCDECNSSFSVGDGLIKESGSKVRCSKCDSVFVAYPQVIEDIEKLETGEEQLRLDGLDSDLGDFLGDDEEDENLTMSTNIDESEPDLSDFDKTLGATAGLESDDVSEDPEGELELDLDFDQDDDPDLMLDDESIAGDDLPELEDLDSLVEAQSVADEVDSDLEDLDLELDYETDAELELEGEDGLDLTDLGLEEVATSTQEEPSAEESDELDLSDLELSLDENTAPEDTGGTGSDDLEFDLELEEEGVAEVAEADLEIEAADELDFSDLDLEMADASVAEKGLEAGEAEAVAGSEESGADELDLSDLTDIIEDEDAPAAVADSGDIDELDLSDLEGIMETGETSTAADDSVQDLELDLDLQMEENAPQTEATEAAAVSQDSDELDFSDLENMLESDETPSVETAEGNDSQELDLQFDLDEPGGGGSDEATAGDTVPDAQDDDFLDIEQLLEEGEEDSPLENVEMDGDVTDLPLEMEAALDDASKGADAELELDFDLESELQAKEGLFEAGETENQLESNLLASDELDFLDEGGVEEPELQNVGATSVIGTDDFDSNDMAETDSAYGETQALPGPEGGLPIMEAEDEAPVEHAPKASRSKKPLMVAVLLFLLAVGVLIIPNMLGIKIPYVSDINIPYLSELDVKIPYLSDWLNPEPQDVAGNLKIVPLGNTIDGNFVDNAKSGQLFVIKGHIKNDYDHPRSYIKVTGKIFLKGQKMARQATVYCGNTLSNSELASLDMAAINKKLSFRSGDKRSNFKVSTGKKVPFMIVFDKLPDNLDEYTVEVEGSAI